MLLIEDDQSHPRVFYPKKDYKVVKYMDVTRFLSMVSKKGLFFCRADIFEDKYEGVFTPSTVDNRNKYLENLKSHPLPGDIVTQEDVDKTISFNEEFDNQQRSLFCINCWNKQEFESAALWKIYSDFKIGLLIESSVYNLKKSFEGCSEVVQLSEVFYISRSKDSTPYNNSIYPFLFKDRAYKYEDEVRLIHYIVPKEGWKFDWENEEVNEGLYLKVNLQILISRIVLSPDSPKWFFNLIQDVCDKFNLNVKIEFSSLA